MDSCINSHIHMTRSGTPSSRPMMAAAFAALGCLAFGSPSEAAHFKCAGGDVSCLITAIREANVNGKRNTISLGAGVYTVTDVDNTSGPFSFNGFPVITGRIDINGVSAETTIIERLEFAPRFRFFEINETASLSPAM